MDFLFYAQESDIAQESQIMEHYYRPCHSKGKFPGIVQEFNAVYITSQPTYVYRQHLRVAPVFCID
ncbi:MAG: hypothetical protein R3C17_01085 [Planctomycetaceae bacterium]